MVDLNVHSVSMWDNNLKNIHFLLAMYFRKSIEVIKYLTANCVGLLIVMDTTPSFASSYFHFPIPTYFLKMVVGMEKVWLYPQTRCVQLLCQSNTPKLLLDNMEKCKRANGEVRDFPPPFSCHKSCLAAQNKLVLETLLLALYPLPFITSEELQKAWKKITTSYPRNLWTNTANISRSAFLSRRRENVCHLYNQSFLLPLWPFGEFNRANCSSFTRRDGYNVMRHLKEEKKWISLMEQFFQR